MTRTSRRVRPAGQRVLAWLTLTAFVATSCGGRRTPTGPIGGGSPGDQALQQLTDLPLGLDLRLSDGRQGAAAYDRARLAPASRLTDADAAALLARAPAVKTNPDDRQDFALRPRSLPPPRTGKTLTGAFPPPPSVGPSPSAPSAADAKAPLAVLRYQPEGAVPLAPQLSVTFSQPMIAVTSQDDAAATVPVTLTPTPKGRWRWIGTRTVLFDPDVRFPQATTYQVEIPAGTKSALGNTLPAAVRFTFETPPPRVTTSWPTSGPQRRDVPMFVLFDQKIDALAVLATMTVKADGKAESLRLLDADELGKHPTIKNLADAARADGQDGRWLAFRTERLLPADADVEVTVGPGTPSAEGPGRTRDRQSSSFRTYAPLRIDEARCGWSDECPPGAPYAIEFNNPLEVDRFDSTLFTVSPDLPGLKVIHNGNYVSLQGATVANRTYKVTVNRAVIDEFGQTLGRDETVTWKVGSAQPNLFGPQGLVVVDPGAKRPTLDYFSVGHIGLKVKLYKVTPADWDRFGAAMQRQWDRKNPPTLPGTLVFDHNVRVAGKRDELTETAIDLTPALGKGGLGHVVAVVEPTPWKEAYDPPRFYSWVQSTRLAVDASVDGDVLVAFASDLGTGKALSGVDLELAPWGSKARTSDRGLATIALSSTGKKGMGRLLARRGDDVAFLSDSGGWWNDSATWIKRGRATSLAWHVTDDRQMYRPGEQVHLKGWLRSIDFGKGGDVGFVPGGVTRVRYVVNDPIGNKILDGEAKVSALGGFTTSFTLPTTPNLGHATVVLTTGGDSHYHGFQIQEFRRPEYEVTAKASPGPHLVGAGADVTAAARYFAGGPLPGAPVAWEVTSTETTFTPPGRDDYVFGEWRPWWDYQRWWMPGSTGAGARTFTHAGKTDAIGDHVLHLDFLSARPAVPMSVSAQAVVTDVNRQAWAASSTLLVHPAEAYVGLKVARPYVDQGTPIDLSVIGVDLDGAPAPGAPIEVRAVRLDWTYQRGSYVEKELDPQTCTLTAGKDPLACQFATKEGGTYQITATILDRAGRANQSKLTVWVSGGDTPPMRDLAQEKVNLIPDKKEYQPGDVAELLIQAPFAPAEGVVSWRRSGILETQRVSLSGPTLAIRVPIAEAHVPNLVVQVDLVGQAARVDDQGKPDPRLPKRPAYAVGSINLDVPPRSRTLAVEVTPAAKKVGPGDQAGFAVRVRDARGQPVAGAEVALMVVDEAVLSLTGFQFANPVGSFYPQRDAGTSDHYLRSFVKLAQPAADQLADATGAGGGAPGRARAEMLPMADGAPMPPPSPAAAAPTDVTTTKNSPVTGSAPAQGPIAVRTNFDPLAAFADAMITDASGKATLSVKMPDNLTRYRVVALAAAGAKQFGKGESTITARLPLMVRPSPPRFLNFGDTFRLPVVVQNQTDAPMTVRVGVRASNAAITDGAGRELTVPANDRVEVQFPAAAELAGTARFQIVGAATTGGASDAAELALPVWTPATTEAFATYGVIDAGAVRQPIALPGSAGGGAGAGLGVVKQFGGLEITTASTNLQALTDAMLYLVSYRFECSEQRASRVLAIAALRDVLSAFAVADMPSPAALEARVAEDLERLENMQNPDGGFPIWERGRETWPYLSVHVTGALVRAKAKGYQVDKDMLTRALAYLRDIERHYPGYYGEEVRRVISSYALYVRKLAGDVDVAKAQRLMASAGGASKLPIEADGWLLGTLAGQAAAAGERRDLLAHLNNRVSETAGAANFTTSYRDGGHLLLASDRRADGVILESLIQEAEQHDLIPKLVTGLLAHKKAGRWLNTQDNALILLALDRYFQTYEKVTPDFVARVWLGDGYAGEHTFRGRQTDRFQLDVPMAWIADQLGRGKTPGRGDLVLQKDGKGRLYYRVGMTYAPADLKVPAADYGFVVERRYEAVDDKGDVVRQADGSWKIKAGARVRVRLTMVAENRRYHVALVDPLPAGLEVMNPALAVTGSIPQDKQAQASAGAYWWWLGTWYEHQNLRDERVEAFASLLWEGVHEYTYVTRATTPGRFVVPPAKAEEMYMPETFGRSGGDRVTIE